jgi:hypothetical protein
MITRSVDQLPLGFNFGANLYGRQGYPQVNNISVNPGDGSVTDIRCELHAPIPEVSPRHGHRDLLHRSG